MAEVKEKRKLPETRQLANAAKVRERKNSIAKPAFCPFCAGKIKIDYKDVSLLSRYVSSRGKIESRHRTKACAKHQRRLAQAIKRARFLALLPYAPKHIWETGGVGVRRMTS